MPKTTERIKELELESLVFEIRYKWLALSFATLAQSNDEIKKELEKALLYNSCFVNSAIGKERLLAEKAKVEESFKNMDKGEQQ